MMAKQKLRGVYMVNISMCVGWEFQAVECHMMTQYLLNNNVKGRARVETNNSAGLLHFFFFKLMIHFETTDIFMHLFWGGLKSVKCRYWRQAASPRFLTAK